MGEVLPQAQQQQTSLQKCKLASHSNFIYMSTFKEFSVYQQIKRTNFVISFCEVLLGMQLPSIIINPEDILTNWDGRQIQTDEVLVTIRLR